MSDDQSTDRIKASTDEDFGKLMSEADHKVDRPTRVTVNIDQRITSKRKLDCL
jgi:hypothetical protein